jgi:hypothetical protein
MTLLLCELIGVILGLSAMFGAAFAFARWMER